MTTQQRNDLAGNVARKVFQQRGLQLFTRGGRQWIARSGRTGCYPITGAQRSWAVRS